MRTRAPARYNQMLWFPLGVCVGLLVWMSFLFQLGPFERHARWRLEAERKRREDAMVVLEV